MHIRRIINRPTSIALKRDPKVRKNIREACQAVVDAQNDEEEYQRILELKTTLPR